MWAYHQFLEGIGYLLSSCFQFESKLIRIWIMIDKSFLLVWGFQFYYNERSSVRQITYNVYLDYFVIHICIKDVFHLLGWHSVIYALMSFCLLVPFIRSGLQLSMMETSCAYGPWCQIIHFDSQVADAMVSIMVREKSLFYTEN